jgi:lysophospholipase L1-like esterase
MLWAVGDSITYGFYGAGYPTTPNPLTDGYVARTAAALGVPLSNTAVSGATVLGIAGSASILQQMLNLEAPDRYDLVVTMLGTNDLIQSGTDAAALTAFKNGAVAGLLHLASNRVRPTYRTERDRYRARAARPSSVAAPCALFVGNTPKQLGGYSPPNGSAAAQALYSAAVADVVATVAAEGVPCYLVDVASVYDPATMGADPPYSIHPTPAGHDAIAAAYLAVIRSHR